MSYRDLFSKIDCQRIIIFEDDFKQEPFQKDRALYDIVRMNVKDREIYLNEIKKHSSGTERKIRAFLESVDRHFDDIGNWNDNVAYGDVKSFFKCVKKQFSEYCAELEKIYAEIKDNEIDSVYGIGEKYGIGVTHPTQYDALFDDYILFDNRAKSFRIYSDYSAETAQLFSSEDIKCSTDTNCVVCIIDNQLDNTERAQEIIKDIKESCKPVRKNIVGCVFSSKDSYEEIDTDIYFEYASKSDVENLEACLAKSAYNYYLSVLKKETLDGLSKAFELAQKSKGIAYYLSQKAQKEGESEYQIINDWLHLLTVNSQTDSNNIKRLITLSRVINCLEYTSDIPDAFIQKLNTQEAFDYKINEYHLPIAAGDIFIDDNNRWYVLIGQDCDMARSISRHPKNALAELLPAEVYPQTNFQKWAADLEKVSIYSFRKPSSENNEILQVFYRQRKFLANEILNLCAYNVDGGCKISLKKELTYEQKRLLPVYMVDYYSTLQKYFSSIIKIKNLAKDDFDIINNPEQMKPERMSTLISITDFKENEDQIIFGLRRVCRLTHTYVFYLYKLYLEYRGRQPFQTINLAQGNEVSLPVYTKDAKTELLCTVRQFENPNVSNPKKWCWIISQSELTRISCKLEFGIPKCEQNDIILDDEKFIIHLPDAKFLVVEKAKDKIIFYIQ